MRDDAVLLLSGGIDSTALAVWRRPKIAVTIDYGQRSAVGELRAARRVAAVLDIAHESVSCDLAALGSGDLSSAPPAECAPVSEWWPFRNQLLVTIGAMAAVKHGLTTVLIGCVKTDARHVDGAPDFLGAIDRVVALQEGGVRVAAPAIELTTAELVREARVPRHLLRAAFSCHRAEFACGTCAGCRKAISTFADLDSLASRA